MLLASQAEVQPFKLVSQGNQGPRPVAPIVAPLTLSQAAAADSPAVTDRERMIGVAGQPKRGWRSFAEVALDRG